jgi:tripartite-type tricarboxylate transporter receptor subunit TctC
VPVYRRGYDWTDRYPAIAAAAAKPRATVSGADGSVGTGRAARARPDGHTISLGAKATHVMNGAFYALQYDYGVLNDFAPVTPLVTFPFLLFARKTMPPKDLNELIAWLKANPNRASTAFTN